eukprot:gb/GEZN01007383.1/.p1 GENE.gb/GEZN01007383.1/~~gb/GEZN01007383.1/.p1  ORF type:complete len:435 (+),score=77.05 gb/GEZN01007383.1/:27-1331(+)
MAEKEEDGVIELKMPYLYEKEAPGVHPVKSIFIKASEHKRFKFNPTYIPGDEGKADIIYKSAENKEYYADSYTIKRVTRSGRKPRALIYCLVALETADSYSKRRLMEEARRLDIQLEYKQPDKFDLVVEPGKGNEKLVYCEKPIPLPDAILVRMGAKITYFGLAVLRQFESMDIKIFNSVKGMEISRDKLFTSQILSARGLDFPKSMLCNLPTSTTLIGQELGFPVIMKSLSSSGGEGVWKFDTPQEMETEVPKIQATLKDHHVIFQKYIASTKGRDLRVVLVNGKVVGAMMRIATTGFKSNVHQGGAVKKIKLWKDALVKLSQDAAEICNLDIAGVDLLLDKEGYKVCEVNSSPGFEGLEKATGINIAQAMLNGVLDFLIARNSQKYARRGKKTLKVVSLQAEHHASQGDSPVKTQPPSTTTPMQPPPKKQKV